MNYMEEPRNSVWPLISIIVPVYNVKKFLRRSVESLETQTYPNLEIILIDDGSNDGSEILCDELAEMYSNILVVHQENRGVSFARNVGLDVMHGEYVGFVDADDYTESDMYELLYEMIKDEHADISCCAFDECYSDRVVAYKGKKFHDVISGYESIHRCLSLVQWITWNKLFSISICKGIRYNPNYISCEDALFCVQTMVKAERVAYNFEEKYHWVRRGGSATTIQAYDHKLIYTVQAWKDIIEICHMADIIDAEREAKFQLIENCGRILATSGVENFPEDEKQLRREFSNGLSGMFWYKATLKRILKYCILLISPVFWRHLRDFYINIFKVHHFIQG